jgi:hypothetical protein
MAEAHIAGPPIPYGQELDFRVDEVKLKRKLDAKPDKPAKAVLTLKLTSRKLPHEGGEASSVFRCEGFWPEAEAEWPTEGSVLRGTVKEGSGDYLPTFSLPGGRGRRGGGGGGWRQQPPEDEWARQVAIVHQHSQSQALAEIQAEYPQGGVPGIATKVDARARELTAEVVAVAKDARTDRRGWA